MLTLLTCNLFIVKKRKEEKTRKENKTGSTPLQDVDAEDDGFGPERRGAAFPGPSGSPDSQNPRGFSDPGGRSSGAASALQSNRVARLYGARLGGRGYWPRGQLVRGGKFPRQELSGRPCRLVRLATWHF